MDSTTASAAIVEAVLLGVALAMDAMAVTLSNSLCEPDMPRPKRLAMPVAFACFQTLMPVLGYWGGTLVAPLVEAYAGVVSLAVLGVVGGRMALEALRGLREPERASCARLTWPAILLEAVATSIDALVVGVSLAATGADLALNAAAIGVTTLACCLAVLLAGRALGERFGAHAKVVGGIILIVIGLRAFLS